MGAIQLKTIKTKTKFGVNIDVMRRTQYVGNIRVHHGHIVCNPVVEHKIRKEIILYEYSWDSGKKLDYKEYIGHIDKCKESINEFIKQNKRKETQNEGN